MYLVRTTGVRPFSIITNKDAEIVTLREAMEKTKKQANECFLKQKNQFLQANAKTNQEIARMQQELEMKDDLMKTSVENAVAKERDLSREKDATIAELRQALADHDANAKNALTAAVSKAVAEEREAQKNNEAVIADLKKSLAVMQEQKNAAVATAVAEEDKKAREKDIAIAALQKDLADAEDKKALEISKAISEHERTVAELQAKLASVEANNVLSNTTMKEKYEAIISELKEEVAHYKDFRSKLSVKMMGESLEVHCSNEYESIRPLMPEAYFAKDNEVSATGSKGDFIYRDYDGDIETISIMFEMKNEDEESTHKHKNQDFFTELDKDRREKNCEYAILVSMLEPESELYNRGIVDVSHHYPRMFVIRPQFFIPMIILLREMARNTVVYKKELQRIKAENIDVTNFEADLEDYKATMTRSLDLAEKKKDSAIDRIDKIATLQQVKKDFEGFDKHMQELDNKCQKLTVKKLTKNAPTIAAMIEQQRGADVTEVAVPDGGAA